MLKGQITIATALIGALGMVAASALAAWSTVVSGVASVRTEVVQVTERESNHFQELKDNVNEIKDILRSAPWAKETISKSK